MMLFIETNFKKKMMATQYARINAHCYKIIMYMQK